jgi:3-hydroxyisobutyrate dehydrogenase-like beta-hydroxyacid dehydrogenase
VATFVFIGFGELASALAAAFADARLGPTLVFSRPRPDPAGAAALRARVEASGAQLVPTLAEAVARADLVLACVPSSAASTVAAEAATVLAPGAVYADLTSAAPEVKERAAHQITRVDGRYADAAVLGAVAASGAQVPIAAAGEGAEAFRGLVAPAGIAVTVLEAPAGAAARLKLLRSVYLKGRDALVAEMMLGARRHGLEQMVAASIAGPGEEVPFTDLAERILRSLALHAGRRADELEASAAVLEAGDVEPAATRGAAERLRRLGALGLRESFDGRRPDSGADVLDRIERIAAAGRGDAVSAEGPSGADQR